MDRGSLLLDVVEVASAKWGANVLFLLSERDDLVEEVLKRSRIPVILATGSAEVADAFRERVRGLVRLPRGIAGSVNLLPEARQILLSAFLDGTVEPGDRILCLASNVEALDMLIFFDVDKDVELTHLRAEIGNRVPMSVMERVLAIAGELAREGREGKPIGALFVVGDTEAVLDRSRQGVINPFQGHPEPDRDLRIPATGETIKEFALIDGAFVIRGDGVVVAAGRYVDVDRRVAVQAGLGGRHLAAASITKATKAIAIAVSSSGAIRVFKDGRVILVLG